jgi:hypothetical protein
MQDDGAFAIAQALKANEDVKITSLNLGNNFLTKFGQVTPSPSFNIRLSFCFSGVFLMEENYYTMQSALTDARDHVYEMNEKEVNIVF